MSKQKQSPAMDLLTTVWEHRCEATSHSWQVVNQSMRKCLHMAIRAGLRFDKGDFSEMEKRFRIGYWFTDDGGEGFYRSAVDVENLSACVAFEAWRKRGPIIADNVETDSRYYRSENSIHRQRSRLAVGLVFDYAGWRPVVTSFNGDGLVVACTYKPEREPEYCSKCRSELYTCYDPRKIAKRWTLSAADIQQDRAEMKRKIEIASLPWEGDVRKRFLSLLCPNGDDAERAYFRLPLSKIERAFRKVCPDGLTKGTT
jgi:hypothetical protein